MNRPLKLITIGNSTGIILPKEILARLRVAQGDALYGSETPDGGFHLTPHDPEFERQMAQADEIMKADRDILHILAK